MTFMRALAILLLSAVMVAAPPISVLIAATPGPGKLVLKGSYKCKKHCR